MFKKSLLTLGALAFAGGVYAQATLEEVKKRGELICGVSTGLTGFSGQDDKGEWSGIDVDVCRGVAAAVFGDGKKVKFKPLTSKERFTALASKDVDILARNTTATFSRDTDLKFTFLPVNYYDGQGFMVRKALKVDSAKKLNGARVCIQPGTTTELNLADYFRINNMKYVSVVTETDDISMEKLRAGACDVYTTDRSGLASTRSGEKNPDDYVVLPEVISKEPLAPLVRHGDDNWADIGRWVMYAMLIAEEKGITKENVAQMASAPTKDPEINRLLGSEGDFGKMLGLNKDWAAKVIAAVGNYDQSYHANLDKIGLKERGLNNLHSKDGLLYAWPFR